MIHEEGQTSTPPPETPFFEDKDGNRVYLVDSAATPLQMALARAQAREEALRAEDKRLAAGGYDQAGRELVAAFFLRNGRG